MKHVAPSQSVNDTSTPKSSSAVKVKSIDLGSPIKYDKITGYRIIDMELLSGIFEAVLCPTCKNNWLRLLEKHGKKQGLAS